MKKFKDLINEVNIFEVWKQINKYYPDQVKNRVGYIKIWKELKSIKRIIKSDIVIVINKYKEGREIYYKVSGNDKNKKLPLALEYSSLSQWLGYYVSNECFENFKNSEIVAHCLWELTWSGFSNKEILVKRKRLFKRDKK